MFSFYQFYSHSLYLPLVFLVLLTQLGLLGIIGWNVLLLYGHLEFWLAIVIWIGISSLFIPLLWLVSFSQKLRRTQAQTDLVFSHPLTMLIPVHADTFIEDWQEFLNRLAEFQREYQRLNADLEGFIDNRWFWQLKQEKLYFSPQFKQALGVNDNIAAFGSCWEENFTWQQIVHPDDIEGLLHYFDSHCIKATSRIEYTCRLKHRQQGYQWFTLNASLNYDRELRSMIWWGIAYHVHNAKTIELALETLALPVSALEVFLQQSIKTLQQVCQVEHGWLGYVDAKQPNDIKMMAHWYNEELHCPSTYAFARSPCAEVIKYDSLLIPQELYRYFPEYHPFNNTNIPHLQSYYGIALYTPRSQHKLGVLVLAGHSAWHPNDVQKQIIKCYAHRLSNELEHFLHENFQGTRSPEMDITSAYNHENPPPIILDVRTSGGNTPLSTPMSSENITIEISGENQDIPSFANSAAEKQRCQSKIILVVDDSPVNRDMVVSMLKRLNYSVETACNGQEAFQKILQKQYTLILMDCEMPIMDGYRATQKLREYEQQHPERPRTLVLALTAHVLEENRQLCEQAGMDGYLTKPLRIKALKDSLTHWLETHPRQIKLTNTVSTVDFEKIHDTMLSMPAEHLPTSSEKASQNESTSHTETNNFIFSSTAQVLDEAVMTQLSEVMSNNINIQEIFKNFLRETQTKIPDFTKFYTEKDFEKIRAQAHRLKGESLQLGLNRLGELYRIIENSVNQQQTESLPFLFAHIDVEIASVNQALAQLGPTA